MANLLDMHFRKTNLASNSEITFDSDMLKLLMAIDEEKTIRQIAGDVDLTPAAFKESLMKLIKLKLIEQAEATAPVSYVGEAFMARLHEILVSLTGPLGEVLIEETAEEMNLDVKKIPRARVGDFVYNIANQMPGDKQKNEFSTAMLEEIKMLGD
jgi:predicted transcriptional regulator